MKLIKTNFKNQLPTIFGSGFIQSIFDDFEDFNLQNKLSLFDRETIPKTNVKELDKEYQIEIALPGVPKDEIKISTKDGILTIKKEEKKENEEKNDNYFRKEFSYSSFERSFTLPDEIDKKSIKSKYSDGILIVTLPKSEKEVEDSEIIEIE